MGYTFLSPRRVVRSINDPSLGLQLPPLVCPGLLFSLEHGAVLEIVTQWTFHWFYTELKYCKWFQYPYIYCCDFKYCICRWTPPAPPPSILWFKKGFMIELRSIASWREYIKASTSSTQRPSLPMFDTTLTIIPRVRSRKWAPGRDLKGDSPPPMLWPRTGVQIATKGIFELFTWR